MSFDRATMSSAQLYQSAVRNQMQLSQDERDRVLPDYLFVLAITQKLELSQNDKDRLRPVHLEQLAVAKRIELTAEDIARLSTEPLTPFVQRLVGSVERESVRL